MKLSLPDVTLVMYESKEPEKGLKVFSHVANLIEFGNHLFVTHRQGGLFGSACWVINDLYKHLTTDHALIIHIDGFPIHPEKWKPEFLHYDYIGALWPGDQPRMGNGVGLRSRRLCYETSLMDYYAHDRPEDEFICLERRKWLMDHGIRFAPDELAADFSLEQPIADLPRTYDDVFMFHGRPDKGGYPTQQFIDAALA